jgi:hypothetical protein
MDLRNPAQVKNLMRRGLRLLVDPEPDLAARRALITYFENRCAYCDTSLAGVQGDMDHLVPAALGGSNALANRVLSCKQCNAQEKRDQQWDVFLRQKIPDVQVRETRQRRIEDWVVRNGGHPTLEASVLAVLDVESKKATEAYDDAVRRLRDVRDLR